MTLHDVANAIDNALQNRVATSDRQHMPSSYVVIVRVLSEYVAAHELDMTRLKNARDIDKEKIKHLEHQIAQLEVRVEELNKH